MNKQFLFLIVLFSSLLFSCKDEEINKHEGIPMNTYFAELPLSVSKDSIIGHWFAMIDGCFSRLRTECIITNDTLYIPVKKALPIRGWSKNADGVVCHLEGQKITFWGKRKSLLITDPNCLFFVEYGLMEDAGHLEPAGKSYPIGFPVQYLDGSTNREE